MTSRTIAGIEIKAFLLDGIYAAIAKKQLGGNASGVTITGPSTVTIYGKEALEALREAIDFALETI